jgi:hypothetical protein
MNSTDKAVLLSLYYTARVAAGDDRWSRMIWAANAFVEIYPQYTLSKAYVELDHLTQ